MADLFCGGGAGNTSADFHYIITVLIIQLPFRYKRLFMYYSIKISSFKIREISDQAFQKENPDPCFYDGFCGSQSGFFAPLKISEHGTHMEVVVVPHMQSPPCKFRFYSSAVAACVTKCLFCHIRLRLCSAADGECRYPQRRRQGFCGWAVRSAPTAARRFGGTVPPPFVAQHHSAHSTPAAALWTA